MGQSPPALLSSMKATSSGKVTKTDKVKETQLLLTPRCPLPGGTAARGPGSREWYCVLLQNIFLEPGMLTSFCGPHPSTWAFSLNVCPHLATPMPTSCYLRSHSLPSLQEPHLGKCLRTEGAESVKALSEYSLLFWGLPYSRPLLPKDRTCQMFALPASFVSSHDSLRPCHRTRWSQA